jgi:predicted ATPase
MRLGDVPRRLAELSDNLTIYAEKPWSTDARCVVALEPPPALWRCRVIDRRMQPYATVRGPYAGQTATARVPQPGRRPLESAHHKLIVITGGPGAGKTTLVDLLRENGFATMPEAGRAIIQDQSAVGGTGLPWSDTALFAELMLSWDIRSYHWALTQTGPVFFDHAVPCVAGYFNLLGRDVPQHVEAAVAAFPYRPKVFIVPPWPEIYRTDSERHQSLDEAERTYDAMAETYVRNGYDVVELPRTDPYTRMQFVLRHTTR